MQPNTCSAAGKTLQQKPLTGHHLRSTNEIVVNLELLSLFDRGGVSPQTRRNCSNAAGSSNSSLSACNNVDFKQFPARRNNDFGVWLTRKLLTLATSRDSELHLWGSRAGGDAVSNCRGC